MIRPLLIAAALAILAVLILGVEIVLHDYPSSQVEPGPDPRATP